MKMQYEGQLSQVKMELLRQWQAAGRFFVAVICLATVGFSDLGSTCARAQGNTVWATKNSTQAEYVMGLDDVLEIVVRNYEKDLNRTVTIRPDGKISFPRVGEVTASGLTASALASVIQTGLKKTGLTRPYVTVTVKEVRSQRARVLGAVKAAGAYDLKPNWRVMDLVAVAGGLSTKPVRIAGRVIRDGQIIPFSVEEAVLNPQGEANIDLRANDLVYLEEQYIERRIHVVGEVAKPGAFDLEEDLGVVELLARAGDATPKASLRKAHVLRGSEKIPLDLQAVLVDGDEDLTVTGFKFQSGDVLVIPENTARYGVMGQVMSPQYYSMPDKASDATVIKALASAGGPRPNGDLRQATITRTADGRVTVIPVNIEAILKGEAPDNIVLSPDDTLNIPLALEPQVHVLGKVAKPGVYELKEGTSPLSLISEAGSPQEGAALQKAYVLRGETQIPINLHAVLNEGQADPGVTGFRMAAGDILMIPENQLRYGVMGQVAKPGYMPYPEKKEEATVLNALAAAGGPLPGATDGADLRGAGIIRMINGKATRIPVNIEDLLRKSDSANNMLMQPDDILYLPSKKKKLPWTALLSPLLLLGRTILP